MNRREIIQFEMDRLDFRFYELERQKTELGWQQTRILEDKERWASELLLESSLTLVENAPPPAIETIITPESKAA